MLVTKFESWRKLMYFMFLNTLFNFFFQQGPFNLFRFIIMLLSYCSMRSEFPPWQNTTKLKGRSSRKLPFGRFSNCYLQVTCLRGIQGIINYIQQFALNEKFSNTTNSIFYWTLIPFMAQEIINFFWLQYS